MSTTLPNGAPPPPPPNPLLPTQAMAPTDDNKKEGFGCLALVLLVIGVVWIFGSADNTSDIPERKGITKSEWLQKVAAISQGGQFLVNSGSIISSKEILYKAVGAPSNTQSIEGDAYLYWECSDGNIQIVANLFMINNQGTITGKINTY